MLLLDQIKNLSKLEIGWDGYDAPTPTNEILSRSEIILFELMNVGAGPEKILASADGGVGFIYVGHGKKRAVIEILNCGEIYTILYDIDGNCDTLKWPSNYRKEIPDLAGRMKIHLA